MKINIMQKILTKTLIYLIASILISCDKGELETDIQGNELTNSEIKFDIENELTDSNINSKPERLTTYIEKDTLKYFTGFGYDAKTNTAKQIAVKINPKQIIFTSPRTPATSSTFTPIETILDLEREFPRNSSIVNDKPYNGLTKLDLNINDNIEKNLIIDENHYNIFFKIRYATTREILNGTPELTEEALELLNSTSKEFGDTYGFDYVKENTLGLEGYYIYTYDYRKVNEYTKNEVQAAVSASLNGLFSDTRIGGATPEQKLIAEKALTNSFHFSNIKGLELKKIETFDDYDSEKGRLAKYASSNIDKLETVELILNSYDNLFNSGAFLTKLDIIERCYVDIKLWRKLSEKIEKEVLLDTNDKIIEEEANEALALIDNIIEGFADCSNSYPPKPDMFDDLIAKHIKSKETVNINRWWNPNNVNHFYTRDTGNEPARHGYSYDGIGFKAFKNKELNTTAIYRWWNPNDVNHFYTKNPSNIPGYIYERIEFYAYPDKQPGTIPIYGWHNTKNTNHFFTKDPSNIPGYINYGIEFYALE